MRVKATLSKKLGWHAGVAQFEFNLQVAGGGTVSMKYPCTQKEYDGRTVGEEITLDIEGVLPPAAKPN